VRLRLVERTIDLGDDGRYLIEVAGDASEIDEETRASTAPSALSFAALAVGAAADHGVAGALRAGAAEAHFREPCRDPLRPRRAA
jgi:hypothetical protein